MSSGRDEGPVYYREIQKNAYLKRIPNENSGIKLLPLAHKKPPLKPMWTLFCVHNGRTPFLEQYPEPEAPATLAHKPLWRASLRSARHVTAGVRARGSAEYDFLIDTEHGPVRMLAPDWESMQDWVCVLRNKLHELKIVSKGENVYCAPPAPPPPRAAARDPTSPLPPTPPVPPDRVPGIELTTPPIRAVQPERVEPSDQPEPAPTIPEPEQNTSEANVDISHWEDESMPSTSQETKIEPRNSVAKICGQNICLDDSILKRNIETTESDEEFFAEIDRLHSSVEKLDLNSEYNVDYKQRLVVNDVKEISEVGESGQSDRPTNVTVIQVSNKPPHTAIPVLGPETNIFNFDFKQKVPVTQNDFVNIVNTEDNVNTSTDNGYGTVFTKECDYGHLSLTTTVSLTGNAKEEGIYERLCLASTSNDNGINPSPLPLRKLKLFDKIRKSSLPNLEIENDSTYEYLFPNNNKNTTVTLNCESNSLVTPSEVNSNLTSNNTDINSEITGNTSSLSNGVNVTTSDVRSQTVDSRNVLETSASVVRSDRTVERSHSQNAYDRCPRTDVIRTQNLSPKRDGKTEKPEAVAPKPIWKRGLTELSLLSKLRLGHNRQEKRQEIGPDSSAAPRRCRREARPDPARRRSTSLSNGVPPGPSPALVPLRCRQAAGLLAEQRRGAACSVAVPKRDLPLLTDYNRQVWVASWGRGGGRAGGRTGDRVVGVAGGAPPCAARARAAAAGAGPLVDILFHRVPLAKIYVIHKRDLESIGIKLDGECNIVSVEAGSPAARAALPPPGRWAVTEVNNRQLNLLKGGEEEMNRLSLHGTEVSVLIQPYTLVKKLRATLKANKPLLSIR